MQRRRRLYQLCALALLLWTAVDLSNVGLCALDSGPIGLVTGHVALGDADDAPWPAGPAVHVDDCFCCSRCVEPTSATVNDAVAVAARQAVPPLGGLPFPDAPPLYHPPQFLG